MKKTVKLYNVLFPLWFLILFPITWLVILPANFVVDSLVLLLGLKITKQLQIKEAYKKSILKVWVFGFLSDFVGAGLLFLGVTIENDWFYEYIGSPISWNPFDNLYSFLYVLLAVILSGLCIFWLNYKVSFGKIQMETKKKRRIALLLAVFTAPYVLFVPSQLLHNPQSEVQFFTNHILHHSLEDVDVSFWVGEGYKEKIAVFRNSQLAKEIHDGINLAKGISKPIGLENPKCRIEFSSHFNHNQREALVLEFWEEREEQRLLFSWKNNHYRIDQQRSALFLEELEQIQKPDYRGDFTVVFTEEPWDMENQVYQKNGKGYYLPKDIKGRVDILLKEREQMDLEKALDFRFVTIEELAQKGLRLIEKEITI